MTLEFRTATPADVSAIAIGATGNVVLSSKPTDWQGLLDVVTQNKDEDLLIERSQAQARRVPFKGYQE